MTQKDKDLFDEFCRLKRQAFIPKMVVQMDDPIRKPTLDLFDEFCRLTRQAFIPKMVVQMYAPIRKPTLSQAVRKMAKEEQCQQERESTDATGS